MLHTEKLKPLKLRSKLIAQMQLKSLKSPLAEELQLVRRTPDWHVPNLS